MLTVCFLSIWTSYYVNYPIANKVHVHRSLLTTDHWPAVVDQWNVSGELRSETRNSRWNHFKVIDTDSGHRTEELLCTPTCDYIRFSILFFRQTFYFFFSGDFTLPRPHALSLFSLHRNASEKSCLPPYIQKAYPQLAGVWPKANLWTFKLWVYCCCCDY